MKKTITTALIASLASLTALAQGRLTFANDSLHLVYYNPDVFPPPMGGSLVYNANMPAGVSLLADLYLGTSSSALSLTTTTTFGATPGEWVPTQTQALFPTMPPGTTVYLKIQVRNAAFAPEGTWTPNFVPPDIYWGFSVEFPFTLGGPIAYPSIVAPPSPWPIGDYPLPGGARGAIAVGYIPEPSALALVGLGVAMMLKPPNTRKTGKAVSNGEILSRFSRASDQIRLNPSNFFIGYHTS
jgi:hypothetical protein